jgi:carbohydrate kinase (thermoresistant glucokinase family)
MVSCYDAQHIMTSDITPDRVTANNVQAMDDPRERMIKAASRLLAERGYESTSFTDVIAASGAPRGSIYHHFPGGKDQLIAEAISSQGDRALALLRQLSGRPAPEVVKGFIAVWRTILTATDMALGCSLVAVTVSGADAELRGAAGRAFERWHSELARLLEQGGVPADDASQLAMTLLAAAEGAVVLCRATRSFEPLEAVELQLAELTARLATPGTAGRNGPGSPPRVVVMGVSGSGKTVVGGATAVLLGVSFLDADSLHPSRNIAKMAAGIPLTAEDREPWLELVGANIAAAGAGIVVACSALRRSYRDTIRAAAPDAYFVHLAADPALIAARLKHRQGHFMPSSLLGSQLETLEPLEPDEAGLTLAADAPVGELAEQILESVRAR